MRDNLQLIAITHRAGQIAEALFNEAMGRHDITARQAQILAAIATGAGASQTHLVERTGIDRSTLSEICRRLARKGLVTRRRTREDARVFALKLTPEGADVLRRAQTAAATAARKARFHIIGLEDLRIITEASEAAE